MPGAVQLTGIRVLEATLPRELVIVAFAVVRLLGLVAGYKQAEVGGAFSPRAAITHQVTVRRYARHKQAALAAHRSLVRSGGSSACLAGVVSSTVRCLRYSSKADIIAFALPAGLV